MRRVIDHQIQVGITVRKPKGTRITREFLLQCLHYYAEHGEAPPGVTVRVIEWTKAGHTYVYEEPHDIQAALQAALRITSNFHFSGVETGLAAPSATEVMPTEAAREREEAEREEAERQRELERRRRSEAAKRGWETRRKLAAERQRELERRRRSEAAKKGWKKRRKRKATRKRRRSKRQRRQA